MRRLYLHLQVLQSTQPAALQNRTTAPRTSTKTNGSDVVTGGPHQLLTEHTTITTTTITAMQMRSAVRATGISTTNSKRGGLTVAQTGEAWPSSPTFQ